TSCMMRRRLRLPEPPTPRSPGRWEAGMLSEMRCDRCRHWGDSEPSWEEGRAGVKTCVAVMMLEKIEDSVSATVDKYDDTDSWLAAQADAIKKARAYVKDGSGYYAALVTGPDFFCALFQEKPDAE